MPESSADGLVWEAPPGALRRPVMVAAFEGWNDAADAATFASQWLVKHGDGARVAHIDPESHIDFQSRRPQVHLVDGVTRSLTWPETSFWVARHPERDLIVVRGVEPSYRWRSFCDAVLEVYAATGCQMLVTFGALLADIPHTRPVRVTGTATDPALIERLGLELSRYEGPTGIVGVLHDRCRRDGIDSVSLWAPVPHYISSPPNPPAGQAILERFGRLVGVSLDLSRVGLAVERWREQIDAVAADDDDIRSYVDRLESRYDLGLDDDLAEDDDDSLEASWGDDLPSGDEIAGELEQFLREQRND
ncbi:MAG: PAC2 family protein [Actinomycetes bacterium]